MSAMEQSRFTLRIHPLVMAKMKYIAETNGRSVNKEIEQILKWVIDDFENKRGRIHIDEEDQPGFRGTKTNKEQLRRLEEQAQLRNRPISSAWQRHRKPVTDCYSMDSFACGFETRDFVPQTVSPQRRISSHGMTQSPPTVCSRLFHAA